MDSKRVTRRQFMQESAIAAAGLVVGVGATGSRNAEAAE
jgi:hypothetical protein